MEGVPRVGRRGSAGCGSVSGPRHCTSCRSSSAPQLGMRFSVPRTARRSVGVRSSCSVPTQIASRGLRPAQPLLDCPVGLVTAGWWQRRRRCGTPALLAARWVTPVGRACRRPLVPPWYRACWCGPGRTGLPAVGEAGAWPAGWLSHSRRPLRSAVTLRAAGGRAHQARNSVGRVWARARLPAVPRALPPVR